MATTKPNFKPKTATISTPKSTVTVTKPKTTLDFPFVFEKINYQIMVAGIVVIILGFLLMLGQNNTDPAVFPAEEIYSFRRITLAPIVVMIGFGIEIVAILYKAKNQSLAD